MFRLARFICTVSVSSSFVNGVARVVDIVVVLSFQYSVLSLSTSLLFESDLMRKPESTRERCT